MTLVNSRADVPVTIDESLCIDGCTLCVEVCPLDALAINPDTGKAYMHVDECWYWGPAQGQRRRRAGLRAQGLGAGRLVRQADDVECARTASNVRQGANFGDLPPETHTQSRGRTPESRT